MDDSQFSHRSNFSNVRKAHKANGKSKPSASHCGGRINRVSNISKKQRKFKHCNQFRDVGKAQRHATAKLKRKEHREQILGQKMRYYGKNGKKMGGTPKTIAIVPLSMNVDCNQILINLLNYSDCTLDMNECMLHECQYQSRNYLFWECKRNIRSILDICKVSDIVLLVCGPSSDNYLMVDDMSQLICSVLRSIGLPNIYGLYQDCSSINNNKNDIHIQCTLNSNIKKCFMKFMEHHFTSDNNCKIFNSHDITQIFRFMNECMHVEIEWREKRGHLIAQQMSYETNDINMNNDTIGTLHVIGHLRGSQLDISQAMHICGFNDYDFHITQIDAVMNNHSLPLFSFLNEPTLVSENDYEFIPMMKCGNTEKYSLSKIDTEDIHMNNNKNEENKKSNNNEECGILIKDELSDYRGLQNFYRHKWDINELLPKEYARISNINDWKHACKLSRNMKPSVTGVRSGQKVRIHLRNVPWTLYVSLLAQQMESHIPCILWALLENEHKISVCHYLVTACVPINNQSLIEYCFDVGFRRFNAQPIFSDNRQCNKHLILNEVSAGQCVIASIYAPICYPPMPVLMFDEQCSELRMHGRLFSISAHRLLIEHKILNGRAISVNRRRAIISQMFDNPKDVQYFKVLDIWTKNGLLGKIEEPVGEKGNMKCFFNAVLQQNDTVCLSLYKRIFPYAHPNIFL